VAKTVSNSTLSVSLCAVMIVFAASAQQVLAGSEPVTPVTASAIAPKDWLPPVNLIDQNGHPVSFASLKGKVVLMSFIHASCRGVCEMLTEKMHQIARNLGRDSATRVTMVSITTDPAEDGPAQLLAYAKKEGVNAEGWMFLTGKVDQVDKVLALYNIPHEEGHDELTHVMDLYLIGRDGQRLHKYQGMAVAPEIVASDIRKTASP
jgi:cytochrome oxidase Cu insertion factor (SCO1/SenC/PrrC family)